MNFGSDQRVRNAFRATLLDEPSSPSLIGTQEIDAADVLEVTDLAHAIAKAEEVIRARSSRVLVTGPDSSSSGLDIFDQLGAAEDKASATDDTSGPALHAPYLPTPIPAPPPRSTPVPLPPPAALRPAPLPAPSRPVSANVTQPIAAIPPAARTAPILILDEDAFYHPAGRIRSFADVTLDGYRPEPTLMVRLRARRHALSWIVLAVLAPVGLIALFTIAMSMGRAASSHDDEATPTPAKPAATTPAAPATATVVPTATTTTTATATAAPQTTTPNASEIPVFDVNSLKSVPATRR